MTQKTALILSVIVTAFLLVVGGGVLARVAQPEMAAAAVPTTAPVAAAPAALPTNAAPTPDISAQVQELVQQREAQYRQLIDQANQRLTDMNKQLTALQAAQAAPAAPARTAAKVAPTQPAAPQFTLSSDAARDIAVRAANFATMIRTPELVRFEGQVAYEVGFTRGVVYVDANSGAVLFNGTQGGGNGGTQASSGGQPATQPPAPSGEQEHEGGDD